MSLRLLVANFFPAFYPPRSGGEQRYFYLYRHLSRWFDVTLLSPTFASDAPETIEHSASFREHRVPKDPLLDRLHWKLDQQGIGPECSGYVVALGGALDTAYGRRFAELAEAADVVVHECPFTFTYDRTAGRDGKPRIYNAYNVEHRLAAQLLRGEAGRQAVEFIRFVEQSLVRAAHLVLAISEEERQQFVSEFGIEASRVVLAPNGFEPPELSNRDQSEGARLEERARRVVFMGSAHPPNVEAVAFIAQELAPALPDVEFRIMGAVCEHLPRHLPRNVTSLGFVTEANKMRELQGCAAAVNPLFSGAGTNLKMLDYMAAGAPIVTTPTGARGLDLQDGVECRIVESTAVASAIAEVIADPATSRAMGEHAREKAFGDYTWSHIAERIRGAIEVSAFRPHERAAPNRRRARVLVVNDFPVSSATGGGHVRIRELLGELGKEFDVVFLCLGAASGRQSSLMATGVRQIEIPKTAEHRNAEERAGAEATISVSDILAADFVLQNAAFVGAFRTHAAEAAAIVFEHPYLAPLLKLLPDEARVVYSSLNVETELKAEILQKRPRGARYAARAAELERTLLDRADLTVCVSEQDRRRFMAHGPAKAFAVVENGARFAQTSDAPVEAAAASARTLGGRPFAVFIGSAHMPNVEAATFLVERVAPFVPDVTFGIVGSVCDGIGLLPRPGNVVLLGVLAQDEKDALLRHATFAVNPLFQGGGSSLKVPDFFAAGLPVVSTAVGVRGYDVQAGVHYIAAERDDFAAAVRALAHDDTLRVRIARAALEFGRARLDWCALGARYRRLLRKLIEPDARPRVLVATYRFADPPPGGAEAFLVNVLRALHERGTLHVEVATCDVGSIDNKWHFSAEYGRSAAGAGAPPYVDGLHRFAVDDPDPRTFEWCARLFRVWMDETRRQSLALPRLYGAPILLGGWNFAEQERQRTVRWTSTESLVYSGENVRAVSIEGHAPHSVELQVVAGQPIAAQTVCGDFEWTVDLASAPHEIAIRAARAYTAAGDPRELGVLVRALAIRKGERWHSIDLAHDFETLWRGAFPREWVDSLRALAEARDGADDRQFVAARGPHSTRFRDWLQDNVARYDVVLAQGVPFATPVAVADVALRHGIPLVLLPHFHMEDRYYHWRSYYEVFRRAERVIAAPSQAKSVFFDPLGANAVALPGGGVDPREFGPGRMAAARRAFRALHASARPFVLVLGRKTGGKNYRMVIDAVEAVNARGQEVSVVLMGPDEDRVPVSQRHVCSYGAQPRDVVLGALADSLCLANMSESESFGIVLLESWLAGRPVIAQRRCGAFAELVISGENGYLADSPADIADRIVEYLADTSLAQRHGEAGGKLAERYAWMSLAAAIESVLVDAAAIDSGARDQRSGSEIPPRRANDPPVASPSKRVVQPAGGDRRA